MLYLFCLKNHLYSCGIYSHNVKRAFVLSNAREITTNGKITYLPIYDVMFFGKGESSAEPIDTT